MIWIRHAAPAQSTRLWGRSDVDIAPIAKHEITPLQMTLPSQGYEIICSPALRCQNSAKAVFPHHEIAINPALWEQDFGEYDGARLEDLPDIGEKSREELVHFAYKGGESFYDVQERIKGEIARWPEGDFIIFAHAGVIRAALSLALNDAKSGLAFRIDYLSQSCIITYDDKNWGVDYVNR